jgi:hypothetical protein
MNRLEQYLRRATRGLWGKKRLEVMAELRGSLEARVWKLECQGATPTHALETALLEMGAPQHISAGLMRTHTMPTISKIGFAAIAATALCIASLSSSQAQVGWATPKLDLKFADRNLTVLLYGSLFISLSDLKIALERAGATVKETNLPPSTTRSNLLVPSWDTTLPVRTLEITFVQAGQDYQVVLQALGSVGALDKNETFASSPESAEFVPFSYVLEQLRRTKLPLKLEGWQRPKISLGSFSFTLERAGELPNTARLYEDIFSQWWQSGSGRPGVRNPLVGGSLLSNIPNGLNYPTLTIPSSAKPTTTASGVSAVRDFNFEYRHAIRTTMPANTVFAIVASAGGFRAKLGEDGTHTILNIARTNAQGILEFTAPYKFLEFGGNSLLEKTARADAGSEKHPAQALLFKLMGRLDEGVKPVELVLPTKRKIMALGRN